VDTFLLPRIHATIKNCWRRCFSYGPWRIKGESVGPSVYPCAFARYSYVITFPLQRKLLEVSFPTRSVSCPRRVCRFVCVSPRQCLERLGNDVPAATKNFWRCYFLCHVVLKEIRRSILTRITCLLPRVRSVPVHVRIFPRSKYSTLSFMDLQTSARLWKTCLWHAAYLCICEYVGTDSKYVLLMHLHLYSVPALRRILFIFCILKEMHLSCLVVNWTTAILSLCCQLKKPHLVYFWRSFIPYVLPRGQHLTVHILSLPNLLAWYEWYCISLFSIIEVKCFPKKFVFKLHLWNFIRLYVCIGY
jgi:hypothetical protein